MLKKPCLKLFGAFLYRRPQKSTSSMTSHKQSVPGVYDVPLRPPPSCPKALSRLLQEDTVSINSYRKPSAYGLGPTCYQLPKEAITNNSCYELPAKNTGYDRESKVICSGPVLYRNKSPLLEGSENRMPGLLQSQNGKKEETLPSLDRRVSSLKRSASCLEECTPERTERRTRFSLLESSVSLTPASSEVSSHRRRSFPLTPSYSPLKRCRTDQTPYASPFQQRKRFRSLLPSHDALDLMESEGGFIDSHCHLDFLFDRQGFGGSYADYREQNRDTFPRSYEGCLAVFCNPFTFNKPFKWKRFLAEENVWASFGCHPHNAKDYSDQVERDLCIALDSPKVQALGEIGLDYSNRNGCQKEKQFEVFRRQLRIALKRNLPVVIHCREAHQDGMDIIKEILPRDHTLHLHCFTDTWEWAEKWMNAFPNLFIGITNVVTFPSAESVHEVATRIPLERLLLETDAPYFVPRAVGRTTRHSHPGMAIHVAAQIAALKGTSLERVLKATRRNTHSVYNI